MEPLEEAALIHDFDVLNIQRWLVCVWISLVVCFIAVELLGLDRFLRTVIEGRAFWVYITTFFVLLGVGLSVSLLLVPQIQKFATLKVLVLGMALGFLSAIVAILLNPPLLGKGFAPSLNAGRDPAQLLVVGVLSMGWIYGAIVVLASRWLARRSYLHLVYFLLACAVFRVVELLLASVGRAT